MNSTVRRWLAELRNLLLVMIVIITGNSLPPLQAFARWLQPRQGTLSVITGSIAFAGWAMIIGAVIYRCLDTRRGAFADEVSFREFKYAWRVQRWRADPRWRTVFAMAAGSFVMMWGLFGTAFVLSPPGLKLLVGGAPIYATVRLAWALWKA